MRWWICTKCGPGVQFTDMTNFYNQFLGFDSMAGRNRLSPLI